MKTNITILLDRSGSMAAIKTDMQGAFDVFIEKQKATNTDDFVTLIKFDDQYEVAYKNKPIQDVGKLDLDPRNSTALIDSACRAIDELGVELTSNPVDNVIFVIITDGQENASTKFKRADLHSRISHQKDKYNWEFYFIGANQDAIHEAQQFGIGLNNAFTYTANTAGTKGMANVMARAVGTRKMGQTYTLTEDDRNEALGQ